MKTILAVLALAQFTLCDVSHLLHHPEEISTLPPPPKPYAFGYAAGRFPGHIDRTHTEISDGQGVVKGSYSYVDPHFKIRTVDYVADKQGFHPVLNTPQRALPVDSPVVAAAKNKHLNLYASIANAHHAGVINAPVPSDSASVAHAKAKHYDLYHQIAEQHARIGAERAAEAATAEPNYVDAELQAPHY
ncbi:Cuticular protein 57A [Carabus blaptoides fortunei]